MSNLQAFRVINIGKSHIYASNSHVTNSPWINDNDSKISSFIFFYIDGLKKVPMFDIFFKMIICW